MGNTESGGAEWAETYARGVRIALGGGNTAIGLEAMVEAAMGANAIRSVPAKAVRGEVERSVLRGQEVIFTADTLSPRRARWCVAHAFASWLLEQDGHPHASQKKLRAAVAAELLLPTDTCLLLLPNADAPVLAAGLRVPLSFMLLREAEIFHLPTALVVPGVYARVLGDDHDRLPAELAALELLASRRGIGVQRWDVPEDRGVVIRVAA